MSTSPLSRSQSHPGNPPAVRSASPRRILLCGSSSICGFQNFGDELLCDIYHRWLSNLAPDAEIQMLQFHGVLASRDHWASQFIGASGLVFIGGGYFGEADYPGMSAVQRYLRTTLWALRNRRLYGGAFRAAQQQGIPHAVAGVEAGPIHTRFYRNCVTRILDTATVCTLRTPESADYAAKFGVRREDIRVCVDAVLSLAPDQLPKMAIAEQEALRAESETFRIGLHLSSLGDAHWQNRNRIVDLVRDLIRQVKKGTRVSLFFLHDQAQNGRHPQSRVAAEKFFCSQFPEMAVLPYKSHWQLVGVLGSMSAVVTTKLHVGITARALSVPVLSIPRHQKTRRFYRFIGEEWCSIPADRLPFEGIPLPLRTMLQNWEPGRSFPVAKSARLSAQQNEDTLAEFLSHLDMGRQRHAA